MVVSAQETKYDIVVGGKGDDVISIEDAGAGILAGVDDKASEKKVARLNRAIAEAEFRRSVTDDKSPYAPMRVGLVGWPRALAH